MAETGMRALNLIAKVAALPVAAVLLVCLIALGAILAAVRIAFFAIAAMIDAITSINAR
jgi:hypothetical protein